MFTIHDTVALFFYDSFKFYDFRSNEQLIECESQKTNQYMQLDVGARNKIAERRDIFEGEEDKQK